MKIKPRTTAKQCKENKYKINEYHGEFHYRNCKQKDILPSFYSSVLFQTDKQRITFTWRLWI